MGWRFRASDQRALTTSNFARGPVEFGYPRYLFQFSVGRAVRPRRAADYMRLRGGRRPRGRHPGEQRPVIHRELWIIRRISREDLKDRAQDPTIEGNLTLTNGDSHEEHEHPLFQTRRICSRSRYERIGFGRPRISLRAAVAPEPVSGRFRQGGRCTTVAELVCVFFVGRVFLLDGQFAAEMVSDAAGDKERR
jgi:hypothetical protein